MRTRSPSLAVCPTFISKLLVAGEGACHLAHATVVVAARSPRQAHRMAAIHQACAAADGGRTHADCPETCHRSPHARRARLVRPRTRVAWRDPPGEVSKSSPTPTCSAPVAAPTKHRPPMARRVPEKPLT
jgi:hypothetical protein